MRFFEPKDRKLAWGRVEAWSCTLSVSCVSSQASFPISVFVSLPPSKHSQKSPEFSFLPAERSTELNTILVSSRDLLTKCLFLRGFLTGGGGLSRPFHLLVPRCAHILPFWVIQSLDCPHPTWSCCPPSAANPFHLLRGRFAFSLPEQQHSVVLSSGHCSTSPCALGDVRFGCVRVQMKLLTAYTL